MKIFLLFFFFIPYQILNAQQKPNVIIIYADDLGYGDPSCYGGTGLSTPNIDKLAAEGIRFTNGHTTSATCTPSRYGMITGMYPWRKSGTGVLPGDAALIVPTDRITLPKIFIQAGYKTGLVGKWHLGLGTTVEKNWNTRVSPGPNEVGYEYSFIFPATADRVPTVFLEDGSVVGLESSDPISVSYKDEVGDDPTGKDHPELLKLQAWEGHGHSNTIVNGIGRIGYMSGGKLARWTDEELAFSFLEKAKEFIRREKNRPFFLSYHLTEPHVPRMPATMFKGKSQLGLRGDVILQLDWAVGEIMKELDRLNLRQQTIVIFTSDNGPVLNDGYKDQSVEKIDGHKPAGSLRGGKYSILEGGTRVPFIVTWPGVIKSGVSEAMISQVDLLASFAKFLSIPIPKAEATDSRDLWDVLIGKSDTGRTILVEHARILALIKDNWKYIPPNDMEPFFKLTATDSGGSGEAQLYNLSVDLGEANNLAKQFPKKVEELDRILREIKASQN